MTGKPQICTHRGCTDKTVARRLCKRHYQAAWYAGKLGQHKKQPPRNKDPKICPPEHRHADALTCYNLHQCRCTPCIEHRAATDERRRKDLAYGRYDSGLVDATPVREHILALCEFGIGYKRIAQLSGVGATPVRSLIWGRQDPGPRYGEIPKRVTREKSERILAVHMTIENLAGGAKVSARGTHRRIQALAVRGWSLHKIAMRLRMTSGNFWSLQQRDQVMADTHRRMAEIYEELWNQEPPHHEWHSKAAYTRALNFAARRGWLPPLAWDDIDNDPEPDATTDCSSSDTAEAFLEDVEFLLDAGESPEQVSIILGRKPGTIAALADRHDRLDLARHFWSTKKQAAA